MIWFEKILDSNSDSYKKNSKNNIIFHKVLYLKKFDFSTHFLILFRNARI